MRAQTYAANHHTQAFEPHMYVHTATSAMIFIAYTTSADNARGARVYLRWYSSLLMMMMYIDQKFQPPSSSTFQSVSRNLGGAEYKPTKNRRKKTSQITHNSVIFPPPCPISHAHTHLTGYVISCAFLVFHPGVLNSGLIGWRH